MLSCDKSNRSSLSFLNKTISKNHLFIPCHVSMIVAILCNASTVLYMIAEIGRDALHRSGKFKVTEGIISPVSDAYEKKVHPHYFTFKIITGIENFDILYTLNLCKL